MGEKITTEIKRREKTHDRFKAIIHFEDTPAQLEIQADKTEMKVRDLTKNPNKFSFGKVVARNGNSAEFYMYPKNSLEHTFVSFKKGFTAKTGVFILDHRRLREFINIMMRIRYFLGLSKERRLKFLRKKGFPANIDITRGYEEQ